ncbi:MAG: SMC-Scp complex subunit ScpB [Candidatus Omnitrophota bacterium]
MEQSENNYVKNIVEAVLFVSEKPITLDQIKEIVEGVDGAAIHSAIVSLQQEYTERKSGMSIVEIAGGYQMLTNPDYALYIKKFYHSTHKEKLSKPALETLAIVAYKQPISRLDIELIRGVNCDGVVAHLLEKNLIKIVGRKEVPGRPYIYGTTKQFLEYFGLKSLADLPKLEDFSSLQPVDEQPEQEVIRAGERSEITQPVEDGTQTIPKEEDKNEVPSGDSHEPSQTTQEN